MNYYERHIGDYLKDTAHLSLLEHGIYGRLLDIYYGRESPLPAEQVARLVGARNEEEKGALVCVLGEFFRLDGDSWTHKRCEEEIARYQDKQRKAKASADARWAQTDRNANASPIAMRTHSEGNAPSLQTPDTTTQAKLATERGKPRPTKKAPEGFAVTAEMRAWANENAPGVDANLETEKFRDYTFGTSCIDWPGRWRNWLRKASESGVKAGETAYQRSMRERAAEIHPAIARKGPGAQNPMEVLDGLARIAG